MVHYEPLKHCHVSGHGSREELKLMLGLVQPRHFIPVHGEYRMLVQHALLAEGAGVDIDKIFVLENGQVVEFDGERARMAGSVTAGAVLVDGIAAIDGIGGVILRDRRMLASDGVVMVALTVDSKTGRAVSGPDLLSRGFLSDPEDPLMALGARPPGARPAPAGDRRPRRRERLPEDQDPGHPVALLLPADQAPPDDHADRAGGLTAVATRRSTRRRSTRRRRSSSPSLSPRFVREVLALAAAVPGDHQRRSGCSRRNAGAMVAPWHAFIAYLLGWGVAFAPPLLAGFAVMLWMKTMPAERWMAASGAALVALALLGMFHLGSGGSAAQMETGDGGGLLGFAVSSALVGRGRGGRRVDRARPARGRGPAAVLQHDDR